MSLIGKNIRKIRTVKKMSQSDFAQLFDVARPSVGAYEEGRAEPKIDTAIAIARHFGISIDALLTREITINELLKFKILSEEELSDHQARDKDSQTQVTPFVEAGMQAEYVVQAANKDFINELPTLQLPFTSTQKTRAFRVVGSEMATQSGGIRNSDILICERITTDKDALQKNQVYVVVHQRGIATKRYQGIEEKQMVYASDNAAYKHVRFSAEEIIEMWKPVFLITDQIDTTSPLESRVSTLESKIEQLLVHQK